VGKPFQEPRCLDEYLCTIALDAPEQEHQPGIFSLFAVLCFDRPSMDITIEDETKSLRYGFHAAELRLDTSRCRIATLGRYSEYLKPHIRKFEQIGEDTNKRE